MVSRIWAVAVGVIALAASCLLAGQRPARQVRPVGSVLPVRGSLHGLAHSIDNQLRGTAVGYVALVGRSQVVASGLARKATDPPKLAMGPDVMVNVASVGKTFTTIAC